MCFFANKIVYLQPVFNMELLNHSVSEEKSQKNWRNTCYLAFLPFQMQHKWYSDSVVGNTVCILLINRSYWSVYVSQKNGNYTFSFEYHNPQHTLMFISICSRYEFTYGNFEMCSWILCSSAVQMSICMNTACALKKNMLASQLELAYLSFTSVVVFFADLHFAMEHSHTSW